MLKQSQTILCLMLVACMTCVAALDLTGTSWIWTPVGDRDHVPPGDIALRRSFFPPSGKTPVSAKILIAADDKYTLYVNGLELGTSSPSWTDAHRYCVPLVKGHNVFAVAARNEPFTPANGAGVGAAIEIKYLDDSTETIVTDAHWRAVSGTPAGFEQVAFNDGQWPAASPINVPNLSIPPDNQITPLPLNFDFADWIWTNETVGPFLAPAGARAFRKKITLPNGQLAAQARFLITADDEYTLYINGLVVASGTNIFTAQRYLVNFPPTDLVVIAIYAANTQSFSAAGVVMAAEIVTCDCAENVNVVTDGSWKYSNNVPPNFIEPSFKDKTWSKVFVEGREGIQPWGNIGIPAGNSPGSPPLNGAPLAPPASVVV